MRTGLLTVRAARVLLLIWAALGCLAGAGCSASAPVSPPDQQAGSGGGTAPETGGIFPLPLPSTVYAALHAAKSTSGITSRDGSAFVPDLAQRAYASGVNAVFTPAWIDGASPFDTVAWAVYRFDLRGIRGRPVVRTKWSSPPGDYNNLWIGASNWPKDRWNWYSGAPAGDASLGVGGTAVFRHGDTGELLVAVVVLGQYGAKLERIWLEGLSARGDWWMYGRNERRQNRSQFIGPQYPSLQWKLDIGDAQSWAAPVYDADGTLYIGSYSINPKESRLNAVSRDGQLKWVHRIAYNGIDNHVHATPAIAVDGTIYYRHLNHCLYAVDVDGRELWSFSSKHTLMGAHPLIGRDGSIYIETGDPGSDAVDPPVPPHWYYLSISPAGTKQWEFDGGVDSMFSPAAMLSGEISVFNSSSKLLYAVSQSNQLAWSAEHPVPPVTKSIKMPMVNSLGQVVVYDYGQVYCYHRSGAPLWQAQPVRQFIGDMYLGATGEVGAGSACCISTLPAGGGPGWISAPMGGDVWGTPVADAQGTVYAGCYDSRLYAFDAKGAVKWWYFTGDLIVSPVVIGEDGTLYFTTRQGTLYAIGPGAAAPAHMLGGRITDAGGSGLAGVTVTLSDTTPAVTDSGGYWVKNGLGDGAYAVSPSLAEYSFTPEFTTVQLAGQDIADINFNAAGAGAAEWPVFGRDLRQQRLAPHTGPATPELAWQLSLEEGVEGTPTIAADGTLYVQGTGGTLYALNPDGTEKWRYLLGNPSFATPSIGPDGSVYALSLCPDEREGRYGASLLHSLSPAGIPAWSYLGPNFSSSGVTPAADGTVYTTIYAVMLALNSNGSAKWESADLGCGQTYYSSPSVGTDGVVFFINGSNSVHAVNPDGSVKWSTVIDTENITRRTSLAVADDGTLFGGMGTVLFALDADGTLRWRYDCPAGESALASPALAQDGTVFFGTQTVSGLPNGRLLAFAPGGTVKWQYETGASVDASPFVDAQGTVYAAMSDGLLAAFNPDGSQKWGFHAAAPVFSSPVMGADGTVYLADLAGGFYAIGPGMP